MNPKNNFFDTNVSFLQGIGSQRATLLNEELRVHTYRDLLQHYPFRYEDRTVFRRIAELNETMASAQLKGRVVSWAVEGEGFKKRLTAKFTDGSGVLELVWFQAIAWHQKALRTADYVVYGKPVLFGGRWSITHPDIELAVPGTAPAGSFQPVYSLTEKLRKRYIDSRLLSKAIAGLLHQGYAKIPETLPGKLLQQYRLLPKRDAVVNIHIPQSEYLLAQAQRRLKFEELFYNQLRLIKNKLLVQRSFPGAVFSQTHLVHVFYREHLPFELTGAQKKVLREIHADVQSGKQMNRLLQGDVGSGKTMVAFIASLMAIDNGYQVSLMAPTEVLARQHFRNLETLADKLGITIGLLTGSTRKKEREVLHEGLRTGATKLLVGTHALLEEVVQFENLGLCLIDEQHRFGVAQRARLWEKNPRVKPHILVMTATPIPRTLAMTFFGDLDQSVIDELPPGRKPVQTVHRFDSHRTSVFGFLRKEIAKGRQVYIVYPLIEESEKMDMKDLMDGYESVSRSFPDVPLSIVHGKMKAKDKEYEMGRFQRNETRILVATTVIEVGVDVPNASVMVIENAERFGLAQLHQLRGRVGRGADQSYCILMTSYKLSQDTRKRIETMCRTNNGFEIAEVDLELRGPGDLLGTQQSGALNLLIANIATDGAILEVARASALEIVTNDPDLSAPENEPIRTHVSTINTNEVNWSRIG